MASTSIRRGGVRSTFPCSTAAECLGLSSTLPAVVGRFSGLPTPAPLSGLLLFAVVVGSLQACTRIALFRAGLCELCCLKLRFAILALHCNGSMNCRNNSNSFSSGSGPEAT